MTEVDVSEAEQLTIRHATVGDGARIWRMVEDCAVLDKNSCYAYLLLCRDFSATTLVAAEGDAVLGFVTAYIPPPRPNAVFVWQIGLAASARRRGIGKRLLRELLATEACREVRFLEANVAPSNRASLGLFQSIADELNVELEQRPDFKSEDFDASRANSLQHEPENLVRIGPIEERK